METLKFEDAVVMAERSFARLEAKKKRYIERNAPKYLREELWVPLYITVNGSQRFVHIIQDKTDEPDSKIRFITYALHE